ncbi:MAG: hypothetical protein FWD97_06400 [Defluviitaleaceae bacterium]|nr:hypothetical protein [Defluviitaleaceae bacterium]
MENQTSTQFDLYKWNVQAVPSGFNLFTPVAVVCIIISKPIYDVICKECK